MQTVNDTAGSLQFESDTIVAISTPPGRGGIGIVRLSGPEAIAIALKLVSMRQPLAHAHARLADVLDPQNGERQNHSKPARLDEALVTWFAAPRSYTGEDLVEISAHGSPVILDLLVRQALLQGSRLADPGEFTQRAFLAGRIDLTQAEAVRDLIDAQTLYQARVAAQQMGGALSRRIYPVKQELVNLIAALEAGIDFAEDDIDVMSSAEVLRHISEVVTPLTSIAESFTQGRIVHSGITLAIIGLPNAGKSSLFNRLAERERAIVTANPGTTRDVITEQISVAGIPLEIMDTAGLREANDEAESIGIAKSREALSDADIVLLVLDASTSRNHEEAELLQALSGRPALVAWNKCDLTSGSELPESLASLTVIRTSALSGEGIAELRKSILVTAGASGELPSGLLTNLRQHQAVSGALHHLSTAAEAVSNSTPHEMLILDLYQSLRQLDTLTGDTTSDDILKLIFSTFCIGK